MSVLWSVVEYRSWQANRLLSSGQQASYFLIFSCFVFLCLPQCLPSSYSSALTFVDVGLVTMVDLRPAKTDRPLIGCVLASEYFPLRQSFRTNGARPPNRINQILTCSVCKKYFLDPVALPCGSNICKEHVILKEMQKNKIYSFHCSLCEQDHETLRDGFPLA